MPSSPQQRRVLYKRTVLTPPAFLFSASVHRHVPGNADPPLWSVTPPCAPTGSFTGRTPVRTSSFSVLRPLFPATGRDNGKPVGLVYSPPLPSPMHPVFRTVRGLHAWLHQATTFNEYGPHPRSTIAAAAPWLVCFFGSWHPLLSRRSLRVVPPWQEPGKRTVPLALTTWAAAAFCRADYWPNHAVPTFPALLLYTSLRGINCLAAIAPTASGPAFLYRVTFCEPSSAHHMCSSRIQDATPRPCRRVSSLTWQ